MVEYLMTMLNNNNNNNNNLSMCVFVLVVQTAIAIDIFIFNADSLTLAKRKSLFMELVMARQRRAIWILPYRPYVRVPMFASLVLVYEIISGNFKCKTQTHRSQSKRSTDRQTDKQTDRQTDRRTARRSANAYILSISVRIFSYTEVNE